MPEPRDVGIAPVGGDRRDHPSGRCRRPAGRRRAAHRPRPRHARHHRRPRSVAGSGARARLTSKIEEVSVPVATAADLVLLKLYAGGPQDAWDVEQLLAGPGRAALVAEVDAALGTPPEDSRRLWARIVGSR